MDLRPSVLLSHVRGRHVLTLAAVVLLAYFLWHGLHGKYGLLAWRENTRTLEARVAELEALKAEHDALERRVEGLRGPIDPDLLDEQARRSLSLVGPLDVIILMDERGLPRASDPAEAVGPGPGGP